MQSAGSRPTLPPFSKCPQIKTLVDSVHARQVGPLATLGAWHSTYTSRRLSSGLGLAAGADERQLRTELPRNAMGFQSPVALAINVRIARVTDDIMSSRIYTVVLLASC